MKSNGDLGDDRDSRDLIVDGEDDDDKLTDDGGDEPGNGRVRVVREQERRYANNARERWDGQRVWSFVLFGLLHYLGLGSCTLFIA